MSTPDFTSAEWHKSSHSGDNGGQCVEVAFHAGVVGVRDSKAQGQGPILAFTRAGWDAFVRQVIDDRLN
ncbi:DUF397 domain-containing protein [Streptacidiphilus sp. P02-A3a]|uniref:DUF397 domain-containing protein n=1 Tax=Streptacidiphilus sp. P02-A3a TaxID=2704468 RepID=UPI0015FB3F7B|nr:DUF397 domain-containing protein [Streptacidiphilus sp. P02-A3a]QMU67933.1 DUF397 domain-containing protein [Streptacidiphilus sp. P02-A3a]